LAKFFKKICESVLIKPWQYIGKFMIRWSGDIENYCNILQYIANIANIFIGNILLPGYGFN
jgi:hypothetical protein